MAGKDQHRKKTDGFYGLKRVKKMPFLKLLHNRWHLLLLFCPRNLAHVNHAES
jgi:hypothetical protein